MNIDTLIHDYFHQVLLPLLPEEALAVSYEIVSWHIIIHTYQKTIIESEPFKAFDSHSEELPIILPPRPGDPWQCTVTSHRVQSLDTNEIEGKVLLNKQQEV
jgi:hypothetical protein